MQHVAELARLELSEAEVDRMTGQLDAILTYVAKLDELDTTGTTVTTDAQEVVSALREDEVRSSLTRQEALANAPEQNGESFIVPRIIG